MRAAVKRGETKLQELKLLAPAQVLALLEGPREKKNLRDWALLSCGYFCALRIGEAVAMRSPLFDFTGERIYVPTEKRRDSKGYDRDPVTGRPLVPISTLPIGSAGLDVLRRAAATGRQRTWLFPGADGQPLTTRAAELVFRRWADAASIPRRVTFHALRHTALTRLWERTHDQVLVRDFGRHTSLSSCDDYIHSSPDRWKGAEGALG